MLTPLTVGRQTQIYTPIPAYLESRIPIAKSVPDAKKAEIELGKILKITNGNS